MRKQQKAQLNQLASSSSSLLLAWAGIKTINKTFGPMGVLARYRNICQLRQYLCTAKHLSRAKCKHIPDELWRWQANIVTTVFVDARQT